MYRDIETGEILSRTDLIKEYEILYANGETEAENANDYIVNCMTWNNGTLEEVKA